jgi:hypothetical protein
MKLIGRVEPIWIKGRKVDAKIDTGSYRTSIDLSLAAELKLGPIVKVKKFRSASLEEAERRALVKLRYKLGDEEIETIASVARREKMRYKVIIGRKDLKGRFLVDPSKERLTER